MYMDYKDHSEILSKIPNYFYPALLGELVSIKGTWWIGYADDYGDLGSSTNGWYYAMRQACDKLDLNWIAEYYDSLEWYDSDRFDGELEAKCCELIEVYHNAEETAPDECGRTLAHNAYYKQLLLKYGNEEQYERDLL